MNRRRILLAAALVATATFARSLGTSAESPGPVADWVRRNAVPVATVDPTSPLDDLAPLRQSIDEAQIVGLGESIHGASQELTLKHRTLRFLIEEMGFRSIAWEEDWTTGLEINDYIRTGDGDLDAIMREMSPQWQSREVADVLRWLREYNKEHADKIEFFGVEYYFTRQLAYDAIEAYVAEVAPERLEELRGHLIAIRPHTTDKFAHVEWYSSLPDKQPYILHAHAVQQLIQELPVTPLDRAHQVATHHARQIVSFHEHYNLTFDESNVYREAHAAANLDWWHEFSGDNIAYWAASPHTANAPQLSIVQPAGQNISFPSAGSYLRRSHGAQYLSIGFTFDHGAVSAGPESIAEMPPPAPSWFEQPFGDVDLEQFALDLRQQAPAPVREWLHAPITTRGLADGGPGAHMTGGSLAEWFDVIIHRQTITPAPPP